MHTVRLLTAATLALAATAAPGAQSLTPTQGTRGPLRQDAPGPAPFERLFAPPAPGRRPAPTIVVAGGAPQSMPAVRCATPALPVDPAFDASIRREAPSTPASRTRTTPVRRCGR